MDFQNNVFTIYINIYVHYPEIYNRTVISNRLNKYFDEYFLNNKPFSSEYGKNTYIKFKSIPFNENQKISIDFVFSYQVDDFINNSLNIEKWEDFLFIYFDKQIIEFNFDFKSH